MAMPMMKVRVVRVMVLERRVRMTVGVNVSGRHASRMFMLVVLVVKVSVLVGKGLMDVVVAVLFGDMQPDAETHERAANRECQSQRLTQDHDRRDGPDERRRREVGARSARSEVPKRSDE